MKVRISFPLGMGVCQKQTLFQYLKEINCKDPYIISTKEIIYYLEHKSFSSIAQQNQFIGCLKLSKGVF